MFTDINIPGYVVDTLEKELIDFQRRLQNSDLKRNPFGRAGR